MLLSHPFRRELSAFLVIAETLNLSRAAEVIGVQQSGLSKIIRKLEREAGCSLFVRMAQGLNLTPEGRSLRDRLNHLQLSWSTQPDALSKLRVGAHQTVAATYFPLLIPQILKHSPDTELTFEFAPSRQITRAISAGTVDLGVVVDPEPLQSLTLRTLAQESVAIYQCQPLRAGTAPERILYQPDMVGLAKSLKRARVRRATPVQDYEVIAALAQKKGFAALLPSGVATRHRGLVQISEPLAHFKICLAFNGLYASKELRKLASAI